MAQCCSNCACGSYCPCCGRYIPRPVQVIPYPWVLPRPWPYRYVPVPVAPSPIRKIDLTFRM